MHPVAYTALLLYVIVGISLIGGAERAVLPTRVAGVFIGGLLFLPQGLEFDAPILPPIGKTELAPLVCLAGTFVAHRTLFKPALFFGGASIFVWVSVVGYFGTTITNPDEMVFGPTRRPAISYQDAISGSLQFLMSTASAFWVGRAVFRTPRALEDLLRVIVIAGFTQIPVCLFELKMSPQLHRMVYGYSVISFQNIRRSGGYKPVGFMSGGLSMAIFLYTAFAAALALRRAGPDTTTPAKGWWTPVLWLLLATSKNMGANVFGLISIFATGVRAWKRSLTVAVVAAGFACSYAFLRNAQLIDVYAFTDWLATKSPERAESLVFRLVNEDAMLARVMERPWFGWGGYGRGRVWGEQGVSHTVQDGAWIITMSSAGIVGLVGLFGLIAVPIFGWTHRLRDWAVRDRRLAASFVLIVALRLLDLVPNALFCPTTVFLAGVLSALKSYRPSSVPGPPGVPSPTSTLDAN